MRRITLVGGPLAGKWTSVEGGGRTSLTIAVHPGVFGVYRIIGNLANWDGYVEPSILPPERYIPDKPRTLPP